MAEPQYVWIVSTLGGTGPHVERYELVRKTAKQIVVRCRAAAEHHIRPQIGHHWCFDEASMLAYVKAVYEKIIKDAEARIKNARARMDKPAVSIVPYTPGPPPPLRL